MKKEQQEDFVLNENLSTAQEEKPKEKDADYYTRILVAFTFAASALLILFNVVTDFFRLSQSFKFRVLYLLAAVHLHHWLLPLLHKNSKLVWSIGLLAGLSIISDATVPLLLALPIFLREVWDSAHQGR